MGYLDDNGLARLWEKIKSRVNGIKNVIAPAPNVPINIAEQDTVYLNQVVNSNVVSSHFITGGGGTKVLSHNSGANMVDGVIEITSSGVKAGTFTHSDATMTVDTGYTETPNIFKLYAYYNDALELVAECYPKLDDPFNFVKYSTIPINSIEFNGGIAIISSYTSTGFPYMWQAYI